MRLLFVCPDMRTGGAERHWATLIPELHDRGDGGEAGGAGRHGAVLRGRGRARGAHRVPRPRSGTRTHAPCGSRCPSVRRSSRTWWSRRGVSGQLMGEAIARRSRAVHVMNEHTPLTPDGRLVPPRPHQRALTRLVARRVDGVVAVTQRQRPPLEALGYPTRADRRGAERGVRARRGRDRGVVASSTRTGSRCCACRACGWRSGWTCSSRQWPRRAATTRSIRGYVAGEGSERERLERLAEDSGVTLLGVRRDVLELIRARRRRLPAERG